MNLVVTLLVAGTTGALIGGSIYVGRMVMNRIQRKAQNNSFFKKPIFEKFLIPMIMPITMLILVLLFTLVLMLF